MLRRKLQTFVIDENGATAIEYALIAGIVSIAIVSGLRAVTGTLNTDLHSAAAGLENAND
jgi:pilus assembly protein Flp/PilA